MISPVVALVEKSSPACSSDDDAVGHGRRVGGIAQGYRRLLMSLHIDADGQGRNASSSVDRVCLARRKRMYYVWISTALESWRLAGSLRPKHISDAQYLDNYSYLGLTLPAETAENTIFSIFVRKCRAPTCRTTTLLRAVMLPCPPDNLS